MVRWTLKELARTVGASMVHLRELVDKGVLRGSDTHVDEPLIYTPVSGRKKGPAVELIQPQDGPLWYSKRQVIDDHVRRSAGGSTRFGANQDHDAGEGQPSPPPLAPAAPDTERAHLRARVLQKTSGTCYHCGVQLPARWEIDHLTPRSKGGRHTFDNLVPSCVACNQDKSDTMPGDWPSLSPSPSRRLGERESDGSSSSSSSSTSSSPSLRSGEGVAAQAPPAGADAPPPPKAKPSGKAKGDDPPPLTVDDLVAQGVNRQHAADWLKARRDKGAKHLTPTAWAGLCREAGKAGISPAEAVRICAEREWRGFDASWDWRSTPRTAGAGRGPPAAAHPGQSARHHGLDKSDITEGSDAWMTST